MADSNRRGWRAAVMYKKATAISTVARQLSAILFYSHWIITTLGRGSHQVSAGSVTAQRPRVFRHWTLITTLKSDK